MCGLQLHLSDLFLQRSNLRRLCGDDVAHAGESWQSAAFV
jgi:hypothetical protein